MMISTPQLGDAAIAGHWVNGAVGIPDCGQAQVADAQNMSATLSHRSPIDIGASKLVHSALR